MLLFAAWVARLLGASDLMAVAVGLVVALAPGAYDYLGRDLMGRRIFEEDPLDEDPYLWVGKTRLTRDRHAPLIASDFGFLAQQLIPDHAYLKPMVLELTLDEWRNLDPESDLAFAVITAVETHIDHVPAWTVDNGLPIISMFWADTHATLLDELARDYEGVMPIPSQSIQ